MIDRLQVSQLPERYDLARSAVYTRMDALNIKPEKIGNKSYVNAEQIRLLDALHAFINTGRTTAEFLDMKGLQRTEDLSAEQTPGLSTGLSTLEPDLIRLVAAIAAEMATRLQPSAPEPDQLAYFEKLERAAQAGWLLSTSEVADLLKLPASELQLYGDRFAEAGFVFTRAGYRAGGEVAWRVSKPVK